MTWEIQLSGDSFDLDELSKSLNSPDLRIVKRNGQHFMEWSELDALSTHAEVASAASEFLKILSGASRMALGGRTPISCANTTKLRADGTRETLLKLADTLHVRVTDTITLETSDGSRTVIHQADPIPSWLALASKDSSVAKALRLVGHGVNDWVSLYRLFEVISKDAGGIDSIDSKGWASKDSIRLFKHTANSPGATGDSSRHGSETTLPPPKPMDLSDAKALLLHLLHEWLREKITAAPAAV